VQDQRGDVDLLQVAGEIRLSCVFPVQVY
jgi:hypothetical protein